jgi:hypothetical protein
MIVKIGCPAISERAEKSFVGAGPCACPVFGQPPIEKLGSLPLNVFHGFGIIKAKNIWR